MSISEFKMPFECHLSPDNRWVKLCPLVPWDLFAEQYYSKMSADQGAPSVDARIVLGVVIIKHYLRLDDRGVIEMIQENPYLQFFLGLKGFTESPVFDPSLLVVAKL
ncbi:MAG: transposase [Bacteroidales bacterium]